MEINSKIYNSIVNKTKNGTEIPFIEKGGVKVHKLTIFEDIVLRNLNNLNTVALEINGNKLTYLEFFSEVEKYISSFKKMGLKENDVVSLCLPVGVEFICSYFALSVLGITCNALNIMFLLHNGVKKFLSEKCSNTLICDENYYKLLLFNNALNDDKLKTLIISGDATYTHFTDNEKIIIPGKPLKSVDMLTLDEFLSNSDLNEEINPVQYNEERISTLNYTSGTTGEPKCMGHSELASLFLVASHDSIRRDEYIGDRTLLTIPLQHPTGLFYAMVLQMAQGKTLVLEPRYDKTLFAMDIKTLKINHAVQAKPFYAQLIQDRADGKLKPGDFELFRNAYSGGEGIPLSVCRDINDTLRYAGCPNPIYLGYGRSEEGSLTITPYNMDGRENSCGKPLPGIRAKIVDAKTLKDIPQVVGAKGEILVNTPVHPIYNCYLDLFNKPGKSDNSIVEDGVRWSRGGDIGVLKELPNGELTILPLGRSFDFVNKNGEDIYLFDIKEVISDIEEIQECEVLTIPNSQSPIITVHLVLKKEYKDCMENVVKKIYELTDYVDAVKFYDNFGINATSGKCDREAMCQEMQGFYFVENGLVKEVNFIREDSTVLKRIKN